jgi:hypothetical protein
VFYNVFGSSDLLLKEVSFQIVREQLEQLSTSYAMSAGDALVYYYTIGEELEDLEALCSDHYNMSCVHMEHHLTGNEKSTLSGLYEYCRKNEDQTVIYLHNKGSFHHFKYQDRWRRTMTAATTSELCLNPPENQCNVCGLVFQPLPGLHFPGNMWTAQCSYVKNLLSPLEFHKRKGNVDVWIREQQAQHLFSAELFPWESHFTGKNRYEPEHWVGSHPDLRPCDVSPTASKDYWLKGDRDFAEFEFALAPRHDVHADWDWYGYASKRGRDIMSSDLEARMRDYFLLRGLIFRWWLFYQSLPEDTSWVWKWYPDGDIWREGVAKCGPEVINRITENNSSSHVTTSLLE